MLILRFFKPYVPYSHDVLSIRFYNMIGTSDCFYPREHLSGIAADTVRQADTVLIRTMHQGVASTQIEKLRGSCNMMLVKLTVQQYVHRSFLKKNMRNSI